MITVKLDSLWESLRWLLHILRSNIIFPKSVDEWILFAENDPTGESEWGWNGWLFLRPYFASRGYTLYDASDVSSVMLPRSEPPLAPAALRPYPFARTVPEDSLPGVVNTYAMILKNPLVWGARDASGRDVAIKLISDVDVPSSEWIILQKLNEDGLRKDPANLTIPIIEFLTFDNLVFVVMPRWDCAFDPPFKTVEELMDVGKAYLEALEFLHKHRIAHMDMRTNNCGMNMYAGFATRYAATMMRKPQEAHYILYDFGYSLLYPSDIDINTVSSMRYIRFVHAPDPKGAYNPFKVDVSMMGGLLFSYMMHASSTVPELEPFFYRMMDLDEDKRLRASEARAEFMQIYQSLTEAQLQAAVDARWTNRIGTKYEKY